MPLPLTVSTDISVLLTAIIASAVYYYVYKHTPPSFYRVTRNRIIVVAFVWVVLLIPSLAVIKGAQFYSISSILHIILFAFSQMVNLVGLFLLVASVIELYKRIVKKDKKAMLKIPVAFIIFQLAILKILTAIIFTVVFIATSSQFYECGVKINTVQPDSPASRAGMQENEVIIKVNDVVVNNQKKLSQEISSLGVSEINITTRNATYTVMLVEDEGRPRFGVTIAPAICQK